MELNFTVETKDALLDMVKRHNKMYRMGTPEISDAEYDAEIELLKTPVSYTHLTLPTKLEV